MTTTTVQREVARIASPSMSRGLTDAHRNRPLISPGDWAFTDPFLVLMEDWFPEGVFDRHPHRGFETVTYVLEGRIEHYDNRGHRGTIAAGDAQWLTAGRGLIHNEVPMDGRLAHTLQLWLNLPAKDKLVEPSYQDLLAGSMPTRREPGAEVKVFSGASGSARATTIKDLFVGDAVINRLHGPILEAASASWLGILDRLETKFPDARTVHPGHGASGSPSTLYEDERIYLRTCRKFAAEEIARSGFTEEAKQATVERINARFPYVNPTGIKDIVRSSVDGLFQELSMPNETPVQ